MPSSPADALRELASGYEEALAALVAGDLETVAAHIARGEELLTAPREPLPAGADLSELHARATDAHQKLFALLSSLQGATRQELAATRRGRKALRGYGNQRPATGRRVQSRA